MVTKRLDFRKSFSYCFVKHEQTLVYDDIHMEKWGVFENYFKAGSYLVTCDEGAFVRVKYCEQEISHD